MWIRADAEKKPLIPKPLGGECSHTSQMGNVLKRHSLQIDGILPNYDIGSDTQNHQSACGGMSLLTFRWWTLEPRQGTDVAPEHPIHIAD